eukprot:3545327-Rhodomonas_salina.1
MSGKPAMVFATPMSIFVSIVRLLRRAAAAMGQRTGRATRRVPTTAGEKAEAKAMTHARAAALNARVCMLFVSPFASLV